MHKAATAKGSVHASLMIANNNTMAQSQAGDGLFWAKQENDLR